MRVRTSFFVILIPALAELAGLSGCATVGPGQAGVLWSVASGTSSQLYGEGAHPIWPWNDMYVYDLRIMNHDELLNVIASNGLAIKLDTSVLYHVNPKEVVALQEDIGPQFYDKILEPMLRSEARRVIGRYTPEEIYSTKRDIIEREIRQGLKEKIEGKHLVLEAVLIRNVELPETIRHAIDEKLTAEQQVLKMKYVIEVAASNADRKRIEAQGIADYNRKISGSLSPSILDFERIQEVARLARSSNAKTVVMGPGVNPRILLTAPRGEAHGPSQ